MAQIFGVQNGCLYLLTGDGFKEVLEVPEEWRVAVNKTVMPEDLY